MGRVCTRYPDKHGYWPSSGYSVSRPLAKEVAARLMELFKGQAEGWQTEVEALPPGELVGLLPGPRWCKICGAPTRGSIG